MNKQDLIKELENVNESIKSKNNNQASNELQQIIQKIKNENEKIDKYMDDLINNLK